ncbi:hypothetical protein GW17_00036689 [Ensete ventricosum]|nr:hypothetical protein GW17_00036689 [Ensete ventricosum]
MQVDGLEMRAYGDKRDEGVTETVSSSSSPPHPSSPSASGAWSSDCGGPRQRVCKELEQVDQLLHHEKQRQDDTYVRWRAFIYTDEGVIEH